MKLDVAVDFLKKSPLFSNAVNIAAWPQGDCRISILMSDGIFSQEYYK